jgi:ribosomal-protein-alanine N-acetyltransferase
VKTEHLELIPHIPSHLLALNESAEKYELASGKRIAPGVRDFLQLASADFMASLQTADAADPWKFGFAILHRADDIVIGLCGFAGPPGDNGTVEFGYSIAPAYQGKGYATEAAIALMDFATKDARVGTICAHTLSQPNASTRVLGKCGFTKTKEFVDPEGNQVWRWEKTIGSQVALRPI